MAIPPRRRLSLRLLLALSLLNGCTPETESPAPREAPARIAAGQTVEETRAEFAAICERLRASDDEYYGTAQLATLEAELAAGGLAAAEIVERKQRLAAELLRVGRPGEAVTRLSEALQLSDQYRMEAPVQLQVLAEIGLATLRFGEVRNCVDRHTPEMCIFPIAPGGVHREPGPALDAVRAFRGVLAGAPDNTLARWLLNIAAMTAGQYPEAVPEPLRIPARRLAPAESATFPAFTEVAHAVGLHTFDPSGGALVDDFTGDGLLDVVTSSIDPCRPLRFFVQQEAGTFEEQAAAAGLDGQWGGLNLVHGDYDNDGDLDILVLRGGWMAAEGRIRNSLLRNRGDGTFEDVTRGVGLAEPAYPTQTAAWADFDLDGDLDLAIGNEGPYGGAHPSQLFRNDLIGLGREGFTDIAAAAGVSTGESIAGYWTKAVAWGDYDNDGDPDLYLSRLGPNRLLRNDTVGDRATFTDVTTALGVAEPAGRSFGAWFFDFDNDGDLDLFVADYSATVEDVARYFFGDDTPTGHPRLYRNDLMETGAPGFTDVSHSAGFSAPVLPMGSNFGDLDNDGFLDLYLGTGLPPYEALTPNRMFHNDGGKRFVDVTFAGRFGHLQKGHGVAFADLDEDGDQDVFEQMGGAYPGDAYPSVLYRNPGNTNGWVKLKLVGQPSNRAAMGARVRLEVETAVGSRQIHRVVGTGGSFGGNPLRLEIGLGPEPKIRRLIIRWPGDDTEQVFQDLTPGRGYTILQGNPEPQPLP